MTASVWNPGSGATVGQISADNTYKSQYFTATEGQTIFNLTNFSYAPTTESLFVSINGVTQILTKDYLESSGSAITLVEGARVGDVIYIRGLIGATGAQAAATSASQAAASASSAQIYASSVLSANNTLTASGVANIPIAIGNLVLTIPAAKQFQVGQYVLVVDTLDNTRYLSGQVTNYVGTSLTIGITKIRGAGNIASWNVSVSGIPEVAPDIFANDLMYAQVIATSLY